MNKSFLFFGLLIVLCANTAYAEEGLVAHYTFDENDGTILHEYSGNNNGTIYGATWVDGINGSALSFNGVDDYVFLGNDNSLYSSSMTLIEWLKFNKTTTFWGMLTLNDASGGGGEWGLGIAISNNGELSSAAGAGLNEKYLIASHTTPVNDDRWHFVSTTYDDIDKKLKLYVDGYLVASNDPSADRTFSSSDTLVHNSKLYNWYIGRFSEYDVYPEAGPRYYEGTIDEVKIYNRSLTAEEIKAEYEKFAPPTNPLDSDNDGLEDELELSLELNPHSPDTDSDGINDFEEYNLLSTYAPIFQYAPDLIYTEFYPQPISIFLNHSDLYKSQLSKKVTGPLSEEQIVSYGQGYFMDFKEEGFYSLIRPKNIYKKAYDELLPEYGYLLYMRATTSEYNGNEYIVLQYWHHYLYNAFVNDHEGDWEMVEILLDKSTQDPQYAAYSQHDDSFYRNGGQIKDWANVQKEGNHSVVYVAKGSHASYFEAGNFNLLKWIKNMADWTSSFGRSINFSEFNQTIILRDDADRTTQKWLSYSGRWGGVFIHTDTDMIGTNGPTGPAQKEEKWNHPAEWGLKYLTEIPELKYNAVKLKRGILTVIDDLNRKVTFLNNKIINKIPKAEVVSVIGESFYILPWITPDNTLMSMSLNAQGAPANYTYIIEANETYEFELYLANETEAMHIMFYNVSAEKDTKDTVWIEGNKIYMNTGDALKSLDVVLEYMTDAGEINTTLKGIKFHADETLVIEILDWTKVNEIGNVLINVGKKKCRLKDEGCTKIISKESLITGLLLKIFGPGDKKLIHWNNRSGKFFVK